MMGWVGINHMYLRQTFPKQFAWRNVTFLSLIVEWLRPIQNCKEFKECYQNLLQMVSLEPFAIS